MRGTEYLVGFEFHYDCVRQRLTEEVRRRWQQQHMDDVAREFISTHFQRPHGWWLTKLHRLLTTVASDFDVNGWLGTYPLHLLSTQQWRSLLPQLPTDSRLLDIGAGNGDLTAQLAPLFSNVTTTERSRAMVRRLRRRGFECFRVMGREDNPGGQRDRDFHVVSCLNVIDRAPRPMTLLGQIMPLVRRGGVLVVAVPLPVDPFYYASGSTRAPEEPLELVGREWEAQCCSLVNQLLEGRPDFRLRAASRCPYISGGDAGRRLYVLDDAILVLERTGDSAKEA